MKKISFVTPCFNEEDNVQLIYEKVKCQMAAFEGQYRYEHIFIDNHSEDRTQAILRSIAAQDNAVKLIFNSKNFGHLKSPIYGLFQATGDAVMLIVADLQDPPELIPQFIEKWEEGYPIVIGIKNRSEENPFKFWLRKLYYFLIRKLGEFEHIDQFTGFGLYDRKIISIIQDMNEPNPYFRGMIAELGFERAEIRYTQPRRTQGKTKNSWYILYDFMMLGFVNNSKVPLRIASFTGFFVGFLSLLCAAGYFIYKLVRWSSFQVGIAPMVIGIFFFSSVQLFFIGILGEYIGEIFTKIKNRPLVIEKERINFEYD